MREGPVRNLYPYLYMEVIRRTFLWMDETFLSSHHPHASAPRPATLWPWLPKYDHRHRKRTGGCRQEDVGLAQECQGVVLLWEIILHDQDVCLMFVIYKEDLGVRGTFHDLAPKQDLIVLLLVLVLANEHLVLRLMLVLHELNFWSCHFQSSLNWRVGHINTSRQTRSSRRFCNSGCCSRGAR